LESFFNNRVIQAMLLPWITAQILKVVIELLWRRKLNLRLLTSAGGMPSSHSALVCGLATAIAIHDGAGSSMFALSIVLAMVVMYDAAGIRRWASIQARILNQIIDELFQGHPISEIRLREILGHTPIQVVAGAALGIAMAWWWMVRP
jgi:acid phosphatase family membrane protein YuiD